MTQMYSVHSIAPGPAHGVRRVFAIDIDERSSKKLHVPDPHRGPSTAGATYRHRCRYRYRSGGRSVPPLCTMHYPAPHAPVRGQLYSCRNLNGLMVMHAHASHRLKNDEAPLARPQLSLILLLGDRGEEKMTVHALLFALSALSPDTELGKAILQHAAGRRELQLADAVGVGDTSYSYEGIRAFFNTSRVIQSLCLPDGVLRPGRAALIEPRLHSRIAQSSVTRAPPPRAHMHVTLRLFASDFYTPFSFDNAVLGRSNLGGLGGRCTDAGLCAELQTVTQANDGPTNNLREVRFNLVANSRQLDPQGRAIPVDLRVTNETEYRAWNIRLNGIKRQVFGDKSGFFGVVNLKGAPLPPPRPRPCSQLPIQ